MVNIANYVKKGLALVFVRGPDMSGSYSEYFFFAVKAVPSEASKAMNSQQITMWVSPVRGTVWASAVSVPPEDAGVPGVWPVLLSEELSPRMTAVNVLPGFLSVEDGRCSVQ